MKRSLILLSVIAAWISSCQSNEEPHGNQTPEESSLPAWKKPKDFVYEIKNAKLWLEDSTIGSSERDLVFAVNRTDRSNFKKMDTVLIPSDLSGDMVYYLPFPLEVSILKEVEKIVFFSYATQTFAAYEKGILVQTGPTNMGREKDPTPTGLFFTNWKAKKTISTFNDEWELRWNFNIANKEGIGWHQYTLPGYPASHSCLRLQEKDAKQLYNWADQWVLENKTKVRVKGTPVIVFGSYDFKGPKPWLDLVHDPHKLDISESEIKAVTEPFLDQILMEQGKRENDTSDKEELSS